MSSGKCWARGVRGSHLNWRWASLHIQDIRSTRPDKFRVETSTTKETDGRTMGVRMGTSRLFETEEYHDESSMSKRV